MAQEQLREAHELIERGRITEARQLLETLDDPTARLWLAQLNAPKRMRRQSLSRAIPLPLLVSVAVVIGIMALVVILLLTPTLIRRMQERNQQQPQAVMDTQVQLQLVDLCEAGLGSANHDKCVTWAKTTLTYYHATVVTCLNSSGGATSDAQVKLTTCLNNAGVPLPS